MNGAARLFITTAILFALAGMALGLHMAMSHDHSQYPTHAHIMLAGWVSLALMGLFYHHFPALNVSTIAMVQFWVSALGALIMCVSLIFLYGGNPSYEPGAAAGSIAFLVGMLLFAYNAARTMWRA